jgi:D-galactarolactone cycloisomerase
MKIEKINTYIVSQELGNKSFCFSQAWYNSRTIMLLEIITSDGVHGWGEAFGNAFINKQIIDSVYASRIIGENIFDSGKIWDDLYNCMRDIGQKGSCIQAISAIDIALWDLKGKYTHMPAYRLLGGARRKSIIPYATGLYHSKSPNLEKELIDEATKYAKNGFKAIKMKIGFGVKDDIKMIGLIRKAIGPDIGLMVDSNHAYNASSAAYLAAAIEEYEINWLEEPVIPEDISGYKELKTKTSIPLSGGEAEFTLYGFKHLIEERAVDILQPDCCITGGLSEFQKITALAKINNIQVYPHVWGSAIAVQTGINAAFSMPDFPDALNPAPVYLELDQTENIFREELNINKLKITDGILEQSEFEGIGFEPNTKLINDYRIG